jgi:phosphate starvation-inducible protein PhoH
MALIGLVRVSTDKQNTQRQRDALDPICLKVVEEILTGIEGIDFIHLGARDVVRHKIVQDIVEAYRRWQEHAPGGPGSASQ